MHTTRIRLTGTAVGILAAWVIDLAILVVANIGAPVRVVTGWAPDGADLTVIEIVLTAAVAIAVAGGALMLWDRRSARALEHWTVAVMVLAALSALPLWGLDVETGSKVALTVMHLATGGCAVLGQRSRAARAAAPGTSPQPVGP